MQALRFVKAFWDWLFEEIPVEAKIQPSIFMGKWLVTVDGEIIEVCDSKSEARQWAIANNFKIKE